LYCWSASRSGHKPSWLELVTMTPGKKASGYTFEVVSKSTFKEGDYTATAL
jgi:hypothetical protein